MSDKISVIVPVYNVEKYVRKCVSSILEQTYNDLEIILVDDGSTDNSGKICDEMSNIDGRITVIHKNNGGLSDARNVGIDIMSGKYVTFVDSDDWLEKEYIEYLVYLIKKYNANISVCEFYNITDSGKIINKYIGDGSEIKLNAMEAVEQLARAELFSTSAWGKMYDVTVFEKIRYPIGKLYEDIPVTYDIFLDNSIVAFGARPLYNYFYRENAISNVIFNEKRMDALYHIEAAMTKMIKKYPEFIELAYARIFNVSFNIYLTFGNNEDTKKYYKKIRNNLKKYRFKIIFASELNSNIKIKALCSLFSYKFIQKIIKEKRKRNCSDKK